MRCSFYFLLAAASLTGSTFGRPIPDEMPFLLYPDVGETQCLTESAAPASDCQSLLANPPTPDWTNVAPDGAAPIFKPFCNASCCVFTDTAYVPTDTLLSLGTALLGCTQRANGLVHGVTETDAASVCLADSTGASTCFESSC
ncbi:hypothetical protein B0H11DRAFT_2282452 [Mycena galericulata]|nr:hypothetical protein B0H11DRAFT_2282452 [Mycena galericulata]